MILAAGLSPALQQILRFERFDVGEVNRAAEAHWCASGKVLNAGLALHQLGADVLTLSTLGGSTGQQIATEFESTGIASRWIQCESPTRICTTILDDATGQTTELVENTRPLSGAELDAFCTQFRSAAEDADVIVISGSSPDGVPKTIWRQLLDGIDKPTICDFRGEELLAVLETRPTLVKPNREELGRTLNRDLSDEAALLPAMRSVNESGAEWVVITDGPRDVWMTSIEETIRLTVPPIEVVNPIGCGDCLAAGFACGVSWGESPIDCLRLGIAAAAQNAAGLLPARLDRHTVCDVRDAIEWNHVK